MKRFFTFILFIAMLPNTFVTTHAKEVNEIVLISNPTGLLLEEDKNYSWEFNVPKDGNYMLLAEYLGEKGTGTTPQIGIAFDDEYSLKTGFVQDLPRLWSNKVVNGRFELDDQGNERFPEQTEVFDWAIGRFYSDNAQGEYFTLKKGAHFIKAKMLRQNVYIRKLYLVEQENQLDYEAYKSALKNTQQVAKNIEKVYEAEQNFLKSHPEITVSFDRSTPTVTPNHPVNIRYNFIGGSGYAKEGQWISWKINVEEAGFYELDFVYRQNLSQGLDVHRRLYVNDKVWFSEMNDILFPYSEGFTSKTITDAEGKPTAIYFEPGEYELKLEVVLAGMAPVLNELRDIVSELNRLFTKIVVIVGETPDPYRDYDLVKNISGLIESLQTSAQRIDDIIEILNGTRSGNGSSTAMLSQASAALRKLAEKPRTIPSNQDVLRSQINTIADLTANIQFQPLDLDRLVVRSTDVAQNHKKASFFEYLSFRFKSFIASFLDDYSINGTKKSLNVWVSTNDLTTIGFATGRDQAQIISQLIKNSFYQQTNISARVSLMDTNALVQAMVSGKGPDAALFLPEQVLSNLYYRNALADLSKMDKFNEIRKRFYSSAFVSLETDKGIFALPEVQAYQMMFYRTDIFEEFNLTPPQTWDEFYRLIAVLQKNGMQIGIGESQTTYEMFLLQNNGQVYNKDLSKTLLTSPESIKAFENWTELYLRHSIPVTFDAMNRFRTGQVPLIIGAVSFYSQIEVGAPEIKNNWAMVPVPGVLKDGVINRSQSSIVSGAAVMNDSKEKESAFKLLEWWTRTETQNAFAFRCETNLGVSSRYYPANIETLGALPWPKDEYEALSAQRVALQDIPQSPATYYLTRTLSNAFRRAVYSYENPRDVIVRYGRQVDAELERKREELRLEATN